MESYSPIQPVNIFQAVPRFSHTENIDEIFVKDTRIDYILGLLFLPGILISFFFIWCLALAVAKFIKNLCICRKNNNVTTRSRNLLCNSSLTALIIFFISFVLFGVSSLLVVGKGEIETRITLDAMYVEVEKLEDIVIQINEKMESFIDIHNNTVSTLEEILMNLNKTTFYGDFLSEFGNIYNKTSHRFLMEEEVSGQGNFILLVSLGGQSNGNKHYENDLGEEYGISHELHPPPEIDDLIDDEFSYVNEILNAKTGTESIIELLEQYGQSNESFSVSNNEPSSFNEQVNATTDDEKIMELLEKYGESNESNDLNNDESSSVNKILNAKTENKKIIELLEKYGQSNESYTVTDNKFASVGEKLNFTADNEKINELLEQYGESNESYPSIDDKVSSVSEILNYTIDDETMIELLEQYGKSNESYPLIDVSVGEILTSTIDDEKIIELLQHYEESNDSLPLQDISNLTGDELYLIMDHFDIDSLHGAENLLDEINKLKKYIINEEGAFTTLGAGMLVGFKTIIGESISLIIVIKRTIRNMQHYTAMMRIGIILIFFLSCCLVIGVALSATKLSRIKWIYSKFLSYLIIPLFILAVLVCIVALAVLAMAAIVNADVCENPEGTITKILERGEELPGRFTERLVKYYLQADCYYEVSFTMLDKFVTVVDEAMVNVNKFSLKLGELDRYLSSESIIAIQTSLNDLLHLLTAISVEIDEMISLIDCREINPIYVTIVHDQICTQTMINITWLFSMLGLVSFLGMTMITLRSVIWSNFNEVKVNNISNFQNEEIELMVMRQNLNINNNANSNSGSKICVVSDDSYSDVNTNANIGSTKSTQSFTAGRCNDNADSTANSCHVRKTQEEITSKGWDYTTSEQPHRIRNTKVNASEHSRERDMTESWDYTRRKGDKRGDAGIRSSFLMNGGASVISIDSRNNETAEWDLASCINTVSEMSRLHTAGEDSRKGKK